MKVYFGGEPSQWAWGKSSQTNLWFLHFSGKRIQFWCNNESVVAITNSGHSNKAPRIMDPLRLLVLLSIKHNIFLSGPATSLGFLTKSLMPSPSFRTHVSGRWLPRLKKDPVPSHLKRSRRTQSGDWHELPTVRMSFQDWRFSPRAYACYCVLHLTCLRGDCFARLLSYRSPARATLLLSICASAD